MCCAFFSIFAHQDLTRHAAGSASDDVDVFAPPITFASIAISSNGAAAQVAVILKFTPIKSTPIGANSTITLAMPSGYFLGTAFFTANTSSVALLSGSATAAASSTSTKIEIMISGAAYGPATVTLTLSGLSLGSPRAPSFFELSYSESAQNGSNHNIKVAAPAILNAATFHSIVISANGARMPDVTAVIVFASDVVAVNGTITLGVPPGYFTGIPAIKSNVSSFSATAVVSTAFVTITVTSSFPAYISQCITISGLTLGQPQPEGIFQLSTSAQPGTQQQAAPAIVALIAKGSNVTESFVSMTDEKVQLTFGIYFNMPPAYVPARGSWLEPFYSLSSGSANGTELAVEIGGVSWAPSLSSIAFAPSLSAQASYAVLGELLQEHARGSSTVCLTLLRGLIDNGHEFSSFQCIRPLRIKVAAVS